MSFNFFCDSDSSDGFFGIVAFTNDCAAVHAAFTDEDPGGDFDNN